MPRHSESARLLASIVGVVREWWREDRIRVSPREGRLLRLKPGSILEFCNATWLVTMRSEENASDRLVRYKCQGRDGEGELWIAGGSDFKTYWSLHAVTRELSPDEIEIWDGRSAR